MTVRVRVSLWIICLKNTFVLVLHMYNVSNVPGSEGGSRSSDHVYDKF